MHHLCFKILHIQKMREIFYNGSFPWYSATISFEMFISIHLKSLKTFFHFLHKISTSSCKLSSKIKCTFYLQIHLGNSHHHIHLDILQIRIVVQQEQRQSRQRVRLRVSFYLSFCIYTILSLHKIVSFICL